MQAKLLPSTIRRYADIIEKYWTEDGGATRITHWVELKDGYQWDGCSHCENGTLRELALDLYHVTKIGGEK